MTVATLAVTPGDPVAASAAAAMVVAVSVLARGRRVRGRAWTILPWTAPPAPAVVERALYRSGLSIDPHRAFWTWLGAAGLAVLAAPAVAAGPMTAVLVIAGPPIALFATRHRRAALRRRHLPVVLDAVASALRSGRSVRGALADVAESAGPLAEELAALAARAGAGRRLTEVVADWAETGWAGTDGAGTAWADTRLAGAALATAAELGGPAATALETTAQSLRDRSAADGVVDALSVQARLSALLLTVAPVGFAALMTGVDPTAARFLFHTPVGWLCLATGLALDVAGGLWMQRLVRRAR